MHLGINQDQAEERMHPRTRAHTNPRSKLRGSCNTKFGPSNPSPEANVLNNSGPLSQAQGPMYSKSRTSIIEVQAQEKLGPNGYPYAQAKREKVGSQRREEGGAMKEGHCAVQKKHHLNQGVINFV